MNKPSENLSAVEQLEVRISHLRSLLQKKLYKISKNFSSNTSYLRKFIDLQGTGAAHDDKNPIAMKAYELLGQYPKTQKEAQAVIDKYKFIYEDLDSFEYKTYLNFRKERIPR